MPKKKNVGRPLMIIGSWILLGSLASCGILPTSPDPQPCDCGVAEKELRAYTLKYFDALEDSGMLRQQIKACEEKR